MSRIGKTFARLKGEGRKALVTYITAGDPNLTVTRDLVLALEAAGADIVELGVPFSDPMADGPVIQAASERALAAGTTLAKILGLVARLRQRTQIPIVLMGYYNPILAFGVRRFARAAARAGVDGVLVVDLPPDESETLAHEARRVGLDMIHLLAPTSDAARIRKVAQGASGFLYYVSTTGITGARHGAMAEMRGRVAAIRRSSPLAVVVGFGIKTPSDARAVAEIADGVVVGSALVSRVARARTQRQASRAVKAFVRRLKRALAE